MNKTSVGKSIFEFYTISLFIKFIKFLLGFGIIFGEEYFYRIVFAVEGLMILEETIGIEFIGANTLVML